MRRVNGVQFLQLQINFDEGFAMIKGIGHLGIVVKDIEKSLKALSKIVDTDVPSVKEFPKKK